MIDADAATAERPRVASRRPSVGPGETLGGYVLEAQIARGGMGVLYRARDISLERTVAVKVIAPTLAADPVFRERFRRESRLAAQVEHPNLVPVYRAGQDRGELFIAMRLVEGTDLARILQTRGRLEPEAAATVIHDVACALDAVHRHHLVHRDVKPANVLVADLEGERRVYLTDFGISVPLSRQASLTRPGHLLGTVAYLAPEQIRGGSVEPRTDIYALGAVLYHCVTGEVPYPAASELDALSAHLSDPPPRATAIVPDLPVGLDDVIARAMAKVPTERYGSAGELAAAARQSTRTSASAGRTQGPATPGRTNLPTALVELIGRESELQDLIARCADESTRLVTLTGPGGTGKTHLAIAAAHALREHFTDGVFMVALEGVSEPDAVPGVVGRTLGLTEEPGVPALERVGEHIGGRRMLLLLDNFEHLLEAAPAIARLASVATRACLLVTSQAPLRVRGEHVIALSTLEVPAPGEDRVEALARVPSVAVLVQRAKAIEGDFALTQDNAATVGALCERLDGLPLALELAAARLALLDPGELLMRLDHGIDVLGHGGRDLPPRQRGLRATLDWTCSLLTEDARRLLDHVAVFAGSFTVGLAEAINPGDVVESLASLQRVSLVRRRPDGRLTIPPPVRSYALEHLDRSGDERAVRQRHAEALIGLVEPVAESYLRAMRDYVDTVEPEADNIQEALAWSREHEPLLHARLAAATSWWMSWHGLPMNAISEIADALDATRDPRVRATLLLADALAAEAIGRDDPQQFTPAIEAWRELADPGMLVTALYARSNVHTQRAEPDAAMADALEARALATTIDDRHFRDLAEVAYGRAVHHAGDPLTALAVLGPPADRAPAGSFVRLAAISTRADAAVAAGAFESALADYGQALHETELLHSPPNMAFQIEGILMALAGLERHEDALVAGALADLLRDEFSSPAAPKWERTLDGTLEPARTALGADGERRCRARAAEMGLTRGLAWAGAMASATADV